MGRRARSSWISACRFANCAAQPWMSPMAYTRRPGGNWAGAGESSIMTVPAISPTDLWARGIAAARWRRPVPPSFEIAMEASGRDGQHDQWLPGDLVLFQSAAGG